MIKKMNDFILSLIMIVISLFLIFGNVTVGGTTMGQGGALAKPDVWLKGLAFLMLFFSIVLGIKSLSFKRGEDKEKFEFALSSTVILTVVALILYTILLPLIGFFVATSLLSLFLCMLYSIKENKKTIKTMTKSEWIYYSIRSFVFSAVMVVVLYLVFGKLLAIQLP